jgi:PAS domain S-box-containing protein
MTSRAAAKRRGGGTGNEGSSDIGAGRLFQGLLDSTNLVVYLKDVEGRYLYVNKRYEALAGVSLDQLRGLTDRDIFPPEVAALFAKQDAQVVSAGRPREFEETIPLPAGVKSFITEKFPLFDAEGELRGVGGFCTEITMQESRAEESLSVERERLACTLRCIGDAVIGTDTEGTIATINPAAEELLDLKAGDAVGRPVDEVLRTVAEPADVASRLVTEALAPGAADVIERTLEIGCSETPSSLPPGGGGPKRTVCVTSAVRDRNQRTVGAVLALRDVTEHDRLEAELFQARKLESLGTLAGGIAHDFNNYLTAVLGHLALAQRQGVDAELEPLLQSAKSAAEKAAGVARQLLTFAKGGAPRRRPVDLAKIARSATELALRGSSSQSCFELPSELPGVFGDPVQLDQVVSNLVINALQAMPNGGTMTLRLDEVQLDVGPAGLPAGRYLRLEVEDEGVGIPDEHLPLVFDPFFTTTRGGNGMGLASCASIVKRHEGALTVRSQQGRGSVFTLLLPASQHPAGATRSPNACDQLGATSARILVMDDDEGVRGLLARLLPTLGYDLTLATDGHEALARYEEARQAGQPFDAAILDATIPGGPGGVETLARLRELDPELPAAVMSGYSDTAVMADHAAYGFVASLPKPFGLAQVGTLLKQLTSANEKTS